MRKFLLLFLMIFAALVLCGQKYQVYSDRTDEQHDGYQTNLNGPFWERSANFAALQMYPNVENDPDRMMYATHSHFFEFTKTLFNCI